MYSFSSSCRTSCSGRWRYEAPTGVNALSALRSYSVMVITLDFESSDPGSNPGRTSPFYSYYIHGPRRVNVQTGSEKTFSEV